MRKFKDLLAMIEELLNPEKGYPKEGKKSDGDAFKKDREFTASIHNILRDESKEHLKSHEGEGLHDRKDALQNYTSNSYRGMNNLLRHGEDHEDVAKEWHGLLVKNLKELTSHKTQHEFYAYRGSKGKHLEAKPGSIIHDKGFTSVSLSPFVARGFADTQFYDKDDKANQTFRVHVKPGTKGFYASESHSGTGPDEREFILHPGTKFRVGSKYKHKNGKTFVNLHIHSQED